MAVKSGLMDGFEDGTFRGDQPITDYGLAVILDRALAKRNLSDYRDMNFVDVPKNHWAYKAVCSVCNKEIMTGTVPQEARDSGNWDGNTWEFNGDNCQKRYYAVQWFCRLIEALSK